MFPPRGGNPCPHEVTGVPASRREPHVLTGLRVFPPRGGNIMFLTGLQVFPPRGGNIVFLTWLQMFPPRGGNLGNLTGTLRLVGD